VRRPKESKLSENLISCLDLSNKIWLTVEMGCTAFYDGDVEVAPGMRLITLLAESAAGRLAPGSANNQAGESLRRFSRG
jgi:hypothetical protein